MLHGAAEVPAARRCPSHPNRPHTRQLPVLVFPQLSCYPRDSCGYTDEILPACATRAAGRASFCLQCSALAMCLLLFPVRMLPGVVRCFAGQEHPDKSLGAFLKSHFQLYSVGKH